MPSITPEWMKQDQDRNRLAQGYEPPWYNFWDYFGTAILGLVVVVVLRFIVDAWKF